MQNSKRKIRNNSDKLKSKFRDKPPARFYSNRSSGTTNQTESVKSAGDENFPSTPREFSASRNAVIACLPFYYFILMINPLVPSCSLAP
jgi:hypothetical protein